jgi:DNA-binding transcriptional ArsR family regulator
MVEHRASAELDSTVFALADSTRRAILRALNAVSKHVMVLERAGLLRREVKGREHHCRIEPRPLREADEWLEYYRQFWEQRMDALEVYVARKYRGSKRRTQHRKER